MVKYVKRSCLGILCVLLLVLGGCSTGEGSSGAGGKQASQQAAEGQIDTSPVTLSLYAQMSDAEFKTGIQGPIEKKYPFITMKLITYPPSKLMQPLTGYVASGDVPDIISMPNGNFTAVKQLDLFTDLTPLIKKYNFDLHRLDPSAVGEIKSYSGDDQTLFIPYGLASAVLYYNKDLFDKFGVSYPKDGMTWPEAIELTKKLSRTEGGHTYRGLDFAISFLMNNNQLSLASVDPHTNKTLINTDPWKHWVSTLASVFMTPGNEVTPETFNKADLSFIKDRDLAMWISSNSSLDDLLDAQKSGLNWDMVTMPTFAEAKDTGIMVNAPFYMITSTSKHKDQAFMAIAELLSDET